MKKVFAVIACLALLAVAAVGQQIVAEGTLSRTAEPPRLIVLANGATVSQYYVLSWQPINTPTGACSLSVDSIGSAGITVGGVFTGQDCSTAGTATSSLVTATAVKIKFAILGGGSVYYSLSAWIAVPNVGMAWPNTPGIPICTGTPCASWGTTLPAPDGNATHFLNGLGAWAAGGGGGSGTVTSSPQYTIATYPNTGTTVSGSATGLMTDAVGNLFARNAVV